MLLACSGASNVGQIANRVAVALTEEGAGRMFCLAGVGADLSGFVQSVRDSSQMLVLDGCPVGCGRKTLERVGAGQFRHLVLTEIGIEKNHDFTLKDQDVDAAAQAARSICGELRAQEGGGHFVQPFSVVQK
jgi:uncharacterized metal-binding protein